MARRSKETMKLILIRSPQLLIVFSSLAVISSVSTCLITKTKVWLTRADDASAKDNVD